MNPEIKKTDLAHLVGVNKKNVTIICGPTAVGKTDYGLWLAQKLNGEILSADSRQVYVGMTIASGALPLKHRKFQGVAHHLMGIKNPLIPYTVYNFVHDAERLLTTILAQGKTPIIVGGAGFWIQALVQGLDFRNARPNPVLRKKLEKKLLTRGLSTLAQELVETHPALAQNIDLKNPRRVVRALEIATTHPSLSTPQPLLRPWAFHLIGIEQDRVRLAHRVHARIDAMVEQGLVSETIGLLKKYFFKQPMSKTEFVKRIAKKTIQQELVRFLAHYPSFSGIGYPEITGALMGHSTLPEAIDRIKLHTMQYVKRQLTWFKKQPNIEWITLKNSVPELPPSLARNQ